MRDFLDHEFVPDVLIFNFFLLKEKFIVTSHGDIVATKEIILLTNNSYTLTV